MPDTPAPTDTVVTPTEATPPALDLSASPWLFRDDKGNWAGKGASLPENIPGSPEYEVTKTDRLRSEHAWLFDRAAKVGFYNEDSAQAIFGVPASSLASDSAGRAKQVEDAAWGVLKVKRPEADFYAGVVTAELLPFATAKRDADVLGGIKYPPAFGMRDDELLDFIPRIKNPAIVSEIVRELSSPGYREQKEAIGTGLVQRIRKSLMTVDNQLVVGKTVAEQGPDYLSGLTQQEQRDAFVAMARYKASQKTNIIGDGAAAASAFIQDGGEALAGFADGINPFTNPDEYLSERYRKDPKLRAKAEQVILRATPALSKPIARLMEIQRMGNPEALMSTLDHFTDANESSNQEFLSAIGELQALRQDGAFAPGMKGEKLASFGSGVLNSVVNFKHFVNDSTDPNSYLFLREAKSDAGEGALLSFATAIPGAFTDNYWEPTAQRFSRDRGYEIDKAIQTWSQNHRNITGSHDNVMSRAYTALGMEDLGRIARTAYGDQKLEEQASMIYDPLTLVAGGAGLIGKAVSGAGKVTMAAEMTAKGRALTKEGVGLLKELKAVGAAEAIPKAQIDKIISDVSAATGRQLTESEALLIAVSGTGEDMLSAEGKTAASAIKDTVNKAGLSEDLIYRIADFSAKSVKHANEVKQALPGTTGPKRLISGFLADKAGAVTETIGAGVRKAGEFMAEGGAERALGKWGLNRLIAMQPKNIIGGGVLIGGATWAVTNAVEGKEYWSGTGMAIIGVGAALRPQYLIAAGGKVETWSKVERRIAQAAMSGERISGSPVQAALNAARTELGKTTDIARKTAIEAEMNTLNWMVDSGYEKALQAGFHVSVDNVFHGGTVGMAMAWANDQSASGSGFGIGAAASVAMAGLNRVTQTANRFFNETTRSKEVIANISGLINDLPSEQAARIRTWLNSSKDFSEFIERADSFRKAYDATGGKIVASTPAEMEVVARGVNRDAQEVKRVREEANARHPNDPTAAALYAEQRFAQIDADSKNLSNRDSLQGSLNESVRRSDASTGVINKLRGQITAEEALLAKAGKQSSIVLERLKNDLNNEEVKLKVYMAERAQLEAQLAEANRKVVAPVAFRPGETRTNNAGNDVTMVREGMYIENGPQGGTIHFDISRSDAFTVTHEAWEALLNDNAVKSLVPQLTKALWNKPTEGGRMSPAARTAFFDAYASSLSLEAGKNYREQMKAAQAEYESTGRTQNLERYTREAMAWWMATIDSERAVGYGGIGPSKKLTNVRGEGFGDTLRRITVGERSLYDVLNTDNLRREFAAMFDPEIGLYPRQHTASMVQSLRESGMRFIKQSDGTVRGFWLNNKGEIVRDPVVNRLYESILRMTGGKGSPRINELNLTSLTHTQQAGVLQSAGLSWLVDPDTNTPIPGIETPVAPETTKPTPTAGGTGQPVIDTYNGQPVQPGVNPPRPAPAQPTPSAGGTPTPGAIPPPTPVTPAAGPAPAPTPVQQPKPNPSKLPPLGVVIGGHAQVVLDALTNIPENQRGLTWSVDTAGPKGGKKTVIWGIPTAAEIQAIAQAQGLPDTVRNNVLAMAQTMAAGGERPIFKATYVNVFSRNLSATNEARAYIGKNGYQFVAERTFVPLYFETTTQYWDSKDPKRVLSQSQFEKLSEAKKGQYTPQSSLTAKVFDIDAFQDNKNIIFSDGIRVYGQDGSFTYLKDINGRELNPANIRDAFRDDTEFFTFANDWLQHYNQGGPIDPTVLEAQKPQIVEPSAIRLGNGDRALGETRLTILRAAYGMTTRNGRITVNPTTFTNQVTRGLAFPFTNMSVSMLGEMADTGATSLISQSATTRGQFNMAPAAWELRTADFARSFTGEASGFNQVKMWSHPNIPNTHIIETSSPGSKWNTYKVIVDGVEIKTDAINVDEAKKAAQSAVLNAQDMMDARAYAEKVMREEAARRSKEQATEEEKRKKTEAERTAAETALIKEVKGQDSAWFAQAEKMAKLEAELIAQHEAEVAKRTAESKEKADEIERRLLDIQTERTRINAELKADILHRSQVKLEGHEKENIARTAEVDNEARRESEQLKQDIIARSAARAAEDARTLEDAINSHSMELDVGEILRRSLRVNPDALPVAGDNRLVLRRVTGQKPIVTQTLTAKQQVGPAVNAAQGNIRVAKALGSPEAQAAVPSLNKYLEQMQTGKMEVLRAINDVWKTEMGNQLHAIYTGLDAKGKPKYMYHLYGINGQELYRTADAVALYRNMLVNEQRLRGQTTANAPKGQEQAEALKTEIFRQMKPSAYLQSQKTVMERKAEAETARRYR